MIFTRIFKGINKLHIIIYTIFKKYIFTNKKASSLSKQRLLVCNKCEHEDKDPIFGGKLCKKCLCNLSLKTISKQEKCPLNKW